MPENTIKVDRSTRYGNPFKPTDVCVSPSKVHKQGEAIGVDGAVKAFRTLVETQLKRDPQRTAEYLGALRGKNLACWCRLDAPCHADVLLDFANRPAP